MRAQGISFYRKPLLWVLPMLVMLALFYVYPLFDVHERDLAPLLAPPAPDAVS